jgi:hypothetical protein
LFSDPYHEPLIQEGDASNGDIDDSFDSSFEEEDNDALISNLNVQSDLEPRFRQFINSRVQSG